MNPNLLANKDRIKRSLIQKAVKMWNISNINEMDPLVKLLLDALAFELSKVGQSIMASNSKVLEDLATILVPGEQLLALPGHAVLKAIPLDENVVLTPKNQFYIPNGLKDVTFGKIQGDLYFSTIGDTPLVNAQIKWLASGRRFYQIIDGLYKEEMPKTKEGTQFPDGEVWIGIEHLGTSPQISDYKFFLDIKGDYDLNETFRFNPHTTFEIVHPEADNIPLETIINDGEPNFEVLSRQDIVNNISAFYQNRFVTASVGVGKKPIRIGQNMLTPYPESFKEFFDEDTLELFDTNCLWMRVQFPEKFGRKLLEEMKIFLNCFVIVNKRLLKFQHNLSRSGRILPLETLVGEQFLSVGRVSDQRDVTYRSLPDVNIKEGETATYKVYYGNLESFDTRTGMELLEQLTYKVREEGNTFSSLGQDTILMHLQELYESIEVLEGKMARVKDDGKHRQRHNAYVLTFPNKNSEWIEYEYWTTNAEYGNDLPIGTELQQYRIASLLDPNSIHLVTPTMGGKSAPQGSEKIAELRDLVISKNRLVSKSDINNYIQKEVGHIIEKVDIKPGVKIFPHKKKGLVRITDILLTPKAHIHTTAEWEIISDGLEKKIRNKAVRGHHYYVSVMQK